jgi:O-antigen/teichoic acid export membrane protein
MLLRRNILATYASQIYGAIIGIALLPLYLRYLGTEAYGLVAFFAMLQGWFQLLDMGLTQTMGREAARYQGGGTAAHELRALLRWLEILFGVLALAAGSAVFLGADIIAASWLKAERLSIQDIRNVVELMAVTMLLRGFGDLYKGVISGFEKMVWLAAAGTVFATARFVLVIPWLAWVSGSVVDFFTFQLAIGVVENLVMTAKAYTLLPPSTRTTGWSWRPGRHVIGFSLSMSLATIFWVCVSQTDKLLLSGLLSLTGYGWFNLAIAAASGVTLLTGPIITALMPRLTALQAQGNESCSLSVYRDATQWVGLLVWPASAVLAMQAEQVLWIWTGDLQAASQSADILRLYAIGNAVLAVGAFPYYLQFAKGQLGLHLAGTGLFVMALVPSLIWAAPRYGGAGAGWVWLAVNAAYLALWVPLAHARHAPGLHARWLMHDVAPIALLSAGAALASQCLPWPEHRGLAALELVCVAGLALLAAAAGSSWARGAFTRFLWQRSLQSQI